MNFLFQSLENELNKIDEFDTNSRVKAAIKICQDYLAKLKEYVNDNPFKTIEEEIYFFKFTKPKFLSKLIFYLKWYNIQTRKIALDNDAIVKYYQKEYRRLKRFSKETLSFKHIFT